MTKVIAVYIVASKMNGTLYTGVTSDLVQRIWQHKQRLGDGFAKKYGCNQLVYYEVHNEILSAIAREKQIKAGSRAAKIRLILATNRNGTTCMKAWYNRHCEAEGRSNPCFSAVEGGLLRCARNDQYSS